MDKSKLKKDSKESKESKDSKETKEDPETKDSKDSKESHDGIKLLFDDRRSIKNTIDFYIQPTTKKYLKKSRRKEKKLRKKLKKISKETKIEKLKENGILKNNNNVPDDIINVIFDNMV